MGKKLKYKDVVKKTGGPKQFNKNKTNKKSFKHKEKRKTYSIYKDDSKKRKQTYSDSVSEEKKFKPEEKPVRKPKSESEAEEDEPCVDYMQLLRESFGEKLLKVKETPISSESSSESEEEVESEADNEQPTQDEATNNTSEPEEDESDVEVENVDNSDDPFMKHVSYELHPSLLESMQMSTYNTVIKKNWPKLGELVIQIPKCEANETKKSTLLDTTVYAVPSPAPKRFAATSSIEELHIKSQIASNLLQANKTVLTNDQSFLTPLQQEMFAIINNYQDLYFPERTFENADEIRFLYCLHAVNHVLKTRTKVLHHNSKLTKKDDVPEEFRDQGLVRPKVLIVVPFKDSAFKVVNTIISIMFSEDKGQVIKKNRFIDDYTGNELHFPKKNPKPEDYEKTFTGNTSDDFKLGISVTKKSLKLYSDFYSSDIIVASPLGLRTIIGAQGEPDRDFDFLTSIELLIMDQADLFFMQNWFHVIHLFDHMHLKPKELHGTDVSRVRQWCLNLWAKFYRQTLIFSSVMLPHLESIFTKKCCNYAGKVKVVNPVAQGSICQVYVPMQHVFRKFSAATPLEMMDRRFDFFVQKVLPAQKDSSMKQTLIFVPSYYDYVRIRNHFKKEDISFVQICEYSKVSFLPKKKLIFYKIYFSTGC